MLATTLTTILRRQGAVEAPYVFSPSELFASSEKGVWYDPSDFTTFYSNTAGTTAITAVEQPVGLMLDKSQGLVLGSEIVTNGNFSSGTTGWSGNGNYSVVNGVLVFTDSVYFEIYQTPGASLQNQYVEVSFDLTIISGTIIFRPNYFSTAGQQSFTTSGTKTFKVYSDGTRFAFIPSGTTVVGASIDNVSIKSYAGNHARAANNSTARPTLRNRYNLLTFSEQFDNAAWTTSNATVTANATTAPDGTTTADKIVETATTANHRTQSSITTVSGITYKMTYYAKAAERENILLLFVIGGGFIVQNYNLSTQTIESVTSAGATVTAGTPTITSAGNGWYRCELVANVVTGGSATIGFDIAKDNAATTSYLGDVTKGIYVWGAQLTTAADDAAINGEYQRIEAAPTVGSAPTYDSDVNKFPPYLFATTDDAMSTASIDFSSGDEMSVFAGVTKQSDAAFAALVELSSSSGGNNGAFGILMPQSATPGAQFRSRGTANADAAVSSGYPAPITLVAGGLGDISADSSLLRLNGVQVASSTNDQGTGNYGNYPLYLFARNGSSAFFQGRLYSLIVRNKLPTADELSGAETYVNSKTRAY